MAGINDVFGVGELEAAGSALIEAYERGHNLGDWRPSTSGCASPAVDGVVVCCGSFARLTRKADALAVRP
jgi:hypothetical protein